MKIPKMISPALAPISLRDVADGTRALFGGNSDLERFQKEIRDFFQVKHCYLYSSGKAALVQTLKAIHSLGPERTKVVVPAYTCYSVPSAITRAGLDIEPCDMNPETLDFDLDHLQNILVDREKSSSILAVVPTHLYGCPADVSRLRKLVKDPGITILEDAAQVMGSVDKEEFLGCHGDIGIFSLGRGKAFSTVEGGIAITDNEQIAAKLDSLSDMPPYSHLEKTKLIIEALALSVLQHPALFWFPKSLPFLRLGETIYDPDFKIKSMSAFQAGISRGWRNKLNHLQSIRKKILKRWKDHFHKVVVSKKLQIPCKREITKNSFIRLPIMCESEKNRKNILKTKTHLQLGVMPSYPDIIDNIPQLQERFRKQKFPGAEEIASHLLTLPVHKYVRDRDMKKVLNLIQTK